MSHGRSVRFQRGLKDSSGALDTEAIGAGSGWAVDTPYSPGVIASAAVHMPGATSPHAGVVLSPYRPSSAPTAATYSPVNAKDVALSRAAASRRARRGGALGASGSPDHMRAGVSVPPTEPVVRTALLHALLCQSLCCVAATLLNTPSAHRRTAQQELGTEVDGGW